MGVQVGECKIRYKHFLAGQIYPKDVPLTLILSPLGLCHNCHPPSLLAYEAQASKLWGRDLLGC